MEIKRTQLVPRGMQQDLSISKFNPEFSYENRNIRITAREDSSLLSITNERGNKVLQFKKAKPTNKITAEYLKDEYKWVFRSNSPVYTDVNIISRWEPNPNTPLLVTTKTTLPAGKSEVYAAEGGGEYVDITDISPKEDDKFIYYSDSVPAPENPTFEGFEGTCIGYATLNEYIILFTHVGEKNDRIYRIKDLQDVTVMFKGNLNFSLEHLIDTLPVYESEGVQKVYWTDSYNQPRVINFINDPEPDKWGEVSYYDFSPSVDPYSFIDVTKNATGGEFAPGVIQYAFTYITDWHGVESNIVDTSSLYYISYNKRAAKKDETCYNSFSIKLSGLDPRYKYVRVYSIHRTSLDTTPTVKILGEYEILQPKDNYIEYWSLYNQYKSFIKNLKLEIYSNATWSEQLPKLDSDYNSFVEAINNAFKVNISAIGNGVFTLQEVFDYIWKEKSYYVEVTDTGVVGTNEDPTALLYKDNSEAVVSTMAAKDSTLFVGGYTISQNASDTEDNIESINIYSDYGTTVVALGYSYDSKKIDGQVKPVVIVRSRQYLTNGVSSTINLRISWSNTTAPSEFIIPEGSSEGYVIQPAGNLVSKIEITNEKNLDGKYYSDSDHIYYLDQFESYPSETIILEGANGVYKWGYRDYIKIEDSQDIGTYTYTPYILQNGTTCTQFKKGQPYRFALQGQYSNGHWGDPIPIRNLENGKEIYESEGSLEEKDDNKLYVYDNQCAVSYLVDAILPQEITPQYTLTDVVTTHSSYTVGSCSNLRHTNTSTIFELTAPPIEGSFWYFPTSCYQGDFAITSSTNLYSQLVNVGGTNIKCNPWTIIYNKEYYPDVSSIQPLGFGNQEWTLPLKDIHKFILFKFNYRVNNKDFFSMWAGSLNRPQTQSFALKYSGNSIRLPAILRDSTNIEGNNFEGKFTTLYLNKLSITLSKDICKTLYNKGYRRVRLLYVKPTKVNRKYPAQGIVTNTIFIPSRRSTNSCWAYTDYLSRPKEVYRVWNESSKFFKNWSVRDGEMSLMLGNSTTQSTAARLLASPYFYPYVHRFYTDYASTIDSDITWNCTWNTRPNYGHLMATYHEVGGADAEKDATERLTDKSYFNTESLTAKDAFNYNPDIQYLSKPHLTVSTLTTDKAKNDFIAFDENIVDFWSPDVEYQEVDKNYFENTVEGFQLRGMTCVVSTTNSNYKTKVDGTVLGVLGYSDSTNYYPFQNLDSLDGKGIKKGTYTDISKVKYLTNPQIANLSPSVHRLYLNKLGNWKMADAGPNYVHMWENLGHKADALTDSQKDKDSQYSYKKYCLNTLMFKELNALYYDINQPSLFIKGDPINSISYYQTAYSGDSVTYNPGMDELLLRSSENAGYNIPIQYKANTHLTFSLAKGDTLQYTSDSGLYNREIASIPVMPELSAYAKYHDSQVVLGKADGKIIFLNIYWWPSKKSQRPDIYRNEAYSVTDSINRGDGQAVWKIALESNIPMPIDITVDITYRLGFWKSDKESQLGRTSITIRSTQSSAIKIFKEDFTTLRNWSTINIKSFKIRNANIPSEWQIDAAQRSVNNNSNVNPIIILLVDNKNYINGEKPTAADPFWLGSEGIYVKDLFDPLQEELLASEYNNVGIQSIIWHRNLPHFLLVDLVRSDAFLYADWTDSGLYQQIWTPCGKPVVLPNPAIEEGPNTCVVEATEGDVFVGRYDCLRTASDSEKIERVNDIVSFICESYVNPDGRADVNRYTTDTRAMNFDNWNVLNPVYSQDNNFFSYNKNDYRVLEHSGLFPNQFSWTLPKYPNSLVDNWANLTFASTYNLEGEYGKLIKLIMHNNQLYAFQDKAISNILFNTRVQVPVSDGLPIELGNSNKVDGVRYITTTSGAQNKWSIAATRSGIYYIDHIRKKLNLITAESIREVTNSSGFSKWALNNFGYSLNELNLQDGMSNWMVSKDSIHDDVYIHDKNECLVFSEKLATFTSFFDYKDIPFMFRWDNKFLSIFSENNSTEIYEQNAGQYNQFYGKPKVSSYIDYIVNPEMSRDKIFNNIEFRADAFSIEDGDYTKYVPNRTLDHIHVRNEFQDTGDVALKQYKNLQKKFRIWRAYIPRDVKEVENYKLNRIRNPWIKMKLSYTPTEEEDNKLVLHDLIVNYTV